MENLSNKKTEEYQEFLGISGEKDIIAFKAAIALMPQNAVNNINRRICQGIKGLHKLNDLRAEVVKLRNDMVVCKEVVSDPKTIIYYEGRKESYGQILELIDKEESTDENKSEDGKDST